MNVKRVISFILAVLMALQFVPTPILAEETEPASTEEPVALQEEKAELDVRVLQGYVGLSTTLNVQLANESRTIDLNDQQPNQLVSFTDLGKGTYTLTITGEGYLPYTQELSLDAMHYELSVYAFGKAEDGYGSIVYGDLNNDGVADQNDAVSIIDEIDSGSYAAGHDINRDGKLDMVDVQQASNILAYEQTARSASVTGWVNLSNVEVSGSESTVVSNADALLSQTGSASLATANNEEISESNPVEIGFVLSAPKLLDGIVLESGQIAGGTVIVIDEVGTEHEFVIASLARSADNTIEIDLGGKIAVKKVIIRVNKTNQSTNLVEISKVEFLNGMEDRIPAPELNIPHDLSAVPGNKEFSVSWAKESNVTGYEVLIRQGDQQEVKQTADPAITISMFNQQKLKNGIEYKVQVRSVNGQWKSDYSDEITVICRTDSTPDAPDYVNAVGIYQAVQVTWKTMEDTDYYELYYRKEADTEYTLIGDLKSSSYTITGLENNTKYYVYVVGVNEIGRSPRSDESVTTTANITPAALPAYKLINTSNGTGEISAHVVSATHSTGTMVGTQYEGALGLFDNDYSSYLQVNDWDFGGSYPGNNKGIVVTFDDFYTIGMLSFAEVEDAWTYSTSSVSYDDANGKTRDVGSSIQQKTDANGRKFYLVTLSEPVTTNRIKLGIGHPYGNQNTIRVAEMRLYAYDSLEKDIGALYADDLRITLNENVNEAVLDELQARLDTKDDVSQEFHPKHDALQKELNEAKELFETPGLKETQTIHSSITMKKNANVGGLNAWQPLGISAEAGEELVIYVGHPGKTAGAATDLSLVATQYHAESDSLSQTVMTLKIGRNEITVPEISSKDAEHGGPLYIEYKGTNDNAGYSLRVSGGTEIPVLDLYGISDQSERERRTEAYVEELKAYVASLSSLHDHQGRDYDAKNCVLNTTDILLDQMMLSLPADQILSGSQGSSTTLLTSLDSMEDMMTLFYQHKGLTDVFEDSANASRNLLPNGHLNIRYMRMFAKAFMYAAGNHIGIEYDQTKALAESAGVTADESGKKISGSYFGWGIAHEIGHNINQSQYAVAEVTNNYFSMLATTDHTNATARFSYDVVYDHVTSGSTGAVSDVFLQLAMYWQLHLAYDDSYSYKQFGSYEEIMDNLFYARVDSYARNTGAAPSPQGVALTLGSDVYQNFMRLASAAAKKDLTEFFTHWGFVPDETSRAYMEQFEKETRAIWYINDDAKEASMSLDSSAGVAGQDAVTTSLSQENNCVTLTMKGSNENIFGYEILRTEIREGRAETKVVGFTTSDTYTDVVSGLGNRTVSYTVRAVDVFLQRSNDEMLEQVKLDGDGLIDARDFTAATNMTSQMDEEINASDDDPDAPGVISAVSRVIDTKRDTEYTGEADQDAYIVIDMKYSQTVNGIRLISDTSYKVRVEISQDGSDFQKVSETEYDGSSIVYFNDGKVIVSYDARYVKLTFVDSAGKEISLREAEVIAPNGDNVEIDSVGYLENDYVYADDGQSIKAGSLVFTGSYKGNPAYNVVLVYDENGNIIGGSDGEEITAQQIILAPDPEDALLGNTSDGTWIYWIEPDQLPAELPGRVRVELYRVDNAETNEGQRLVSDTLWYELADTLPGITITKGERG